MNETSPNPPVKMAMQLFNRMIFNGLSEVSIQIEP